MSMSYNFQKAQEVPDEDLETVNECLQTLDREFNLEVIHPVLQVLRQIIKSQRGTFLRNQWHELGGFRTQITLLDKMDHLWHPEYREYCESLSREPLVGDPMPVFEAIFELIITLLQNHPRNQHLFWETYSPVTLAEKLTKTCIMDTEYSARVYDILFSLSLDMDTILSPVYRYTACQNGCVKDPQPIILMILLFPLTREPEIKLLTMKMLQEIVNRKTATDIPLYKNKEQLCQNSLVRVLGIAMRKEPQLLDLGEEMLSTLIKHRLDVSELHELLDKIRHVGDSPSSRFANLVQVMEFQNTNAYIECDYSGCKASGLQVLPGSALLWKPGLGYSLSMWINVQNFSEGDDIQLRLPDQMIRKKDGLLRLVHITSPEIEGTELLSIYLSQQAGILLTWGETPMVFPAIALKTNMWYHVCVLFKQDQEKRKGLSSLWTSQQAFCDLNLYINGGLIRTAKLEHTKSIPKSVVGKPFEVVYGDSVIPDEKRHCVWWLGSTRLYRGVMTNKQVKMEYFAGPEYSGEFHHLTKPTGYFKGNESQRNIREITSDVMLPLIYAFHPDVVHPINAVLALYPDQELESTDRNQLFEAACTGVFEVLSNIHRSYSSKEAAGEFPIACVLGNAKTIHPLPLTRTLLTAGGIENILEFIFKASTTGNLRDSLALLTFFIAQEKENLMDMVNCHGYEILGALLRRKADLISPEVCEVIFSMVEGRIPIAVDEFLKVEDLQLTRLRHRWFDAMYYSHPDPSDFAESICVRVHRFSAPCTKKMFHMVDNDKNESNRTLLANSLALKHMLLDFKIWRKTSAKIQDLVFGRLWDWCQKGPMLVQMVTSEKNLKQHQRMHRWNLNRMEQIGALGNLLDFLLEPKLTEESRDHVMNCIERVFEQEISADLIMMMLGYICKHAKKLISHSEDIQRLERAKLKRQRTPLDFDVTGNFETRNNIVAKLVQILHSGLRSLILSKDQSQFAKPLERTKTMAFLSPKVKQKQKAFDRKRSESTSEERILWNFIKTNFGLSLFRLLLSARLPDSVSRAALCMLHSLLIIIPNYFELFTEQGGFNFISDYLPELALHPRLIVFIFGVIFSTESDFLFPNTLAEPFGVGNLMEAVPIQAHSNYLALMLPVLLRFIRRQAKRCMADTEDGRLLVEVTKYLWKMYRSCAEFRILIESDECYIEQMLEILFEITYGIEDGLWFDSEHASGKGTLDQLLCAFFNRVLKYSYETDELRPHSRKLLFRISRAYPDIFRDNDTTLENSLRVYLCTNLTQCIKEQLSFPMLLEQEQCALDTVALIHSMHFEFIRFCGRSCLRFPGIQELPKAHLREVIHPFMIATLLCTILEQIAESKEIRINAPTDKTVVTIESLEKAGWTLREDVQDTLLCFVETAWRKQRHKELTRLLKTIVRYKSYIFSTEYQREIFFYGLLKILLDSLSHIANMPFTKGKADEDSVSSYGLGKISMQIWRCLFLYYQDLMAATMDREICVMIVQEDSDQFQTWLRRTGLIMIREQVVPRITKEWESRWAGVTAKVKSLESEVQQERRTYLNKLSKFHDSYSSWNKDVGRMHLHQLETQRQEKAENLAYYRNVVATQELVNIRRKLKQDSILWRVEEPALWKDAQMLNFSEGPHRMRKKLERHYDFSQVYTVKTEQQLKKEELEKKQEELKEEEEEVLAMNNENSLERNQSLKVGLKNIRDRMSNLSMDLSEGRLSFDHRKLSTFLPSKDSTKVDNSVQSDAVKERILRMLNPGDSLDFTTVFNCSTLQGMDREPGVIIVCEKHIYFFFHVKLDVHAKLFLELSPEDNNISFVTTVTDSESRGELLIVTRTEKREEHKKEHASKKPLIWPMSRVRQCHNRRFQLQPVAAEVFYDDGSNSLLIFEEKKICKTFVSSIEQSMAHGSRKKSEMKNTDTIEQVNKADTTPENFGLRLINRVVGGNVAHNVTLKWKRGEMSNFAYLIFLNTLAGRSFNDITQYPVFPWILQDFTSEELDLKNPFVYRDLAGPMGVQSPDRAELVRMRYEDWEDDEIPAFHYGTHYSSAAIVLHYLIRLAPYTKIHLELQSGKFDQADRLFRSVPLAWRLASQDGGLQDVKELIPEFYYLPEMFDNQNRFDLGKLNHDEEEFVDHVELPPWAYGDSARFVYLHREALESQHVTEHLHEWIDLIFGYKQTGKEARKATNVFYYLTYEDAGKKFDEITDPVEREAMICSIENFGQTPHQIFTRAHVKRSPNPVFSIYTHSNLAQPSQLKGLSGPVTSLYVDSGQILHCQEGKRITIPPVCKRAIEFGFPDNSLRIYRYDKCTQVFEDIHLGQVEALEFNHEDQLLFSGGEDCVIMKWKLKVQKDFESSRQLISDLQLLTKLYAHSGTITHLKYVPTYQMLISASTDRTVIIWDLKQNRVLNKLIGFPSDITSISVESVSGHIFVATRFWLTAWTVNGMLLARFYLNKPQQEITCIEAASLNEWQTHKNMALASGHLDGSVKCWSLQIPTFADAKYKNIVNAQPTSAFRAERNRSRPRNPDNPFDTTLRFKLIETHCGHKAPITALHLSKYSKDKMWSGDKEGCVVQWIVQKESSHWIQDDDVESCLLCKSVFGMTVRRHHCRDCGGIFCASCSSHKIALPHLGFVEPVRVCNTCLEKNKLKKELANTPSVNDPDGSFVRDLF